MRSPSGLVEEHHTLMLSQHSQVAITSSRPLHIKICHELLELRYTFAKYVRCKNFSNFCLFDKITVHVKIDDCLITISDQIFIFGADNLKQLKYTRNV